MAQCPIGDATSRLISTSEQIITCADNNITIEETKRFAEALVANRSAASIFLTCRELPHNGIGDDGIKLLTQAVLQRPDLLSVGFDHCNLSQDGAIIAAAILRQPTSALLTEFNIANNNIEARGIKALCDSLQQGGLALRSLAVCGNEIGVEGAQLLAAMLRTNRTLTALDCGENDIGNEGAQAISHVLLQNDSLTRLNIRGNNVTPDGLRFLAKMLQTNQTLASLDLSDNNIGDEGAELLATALTSNRSLTQLTLSKRVEDAGAVALAMMLQANTTLRELDLRDNRIGHEGLRAFVNTLKENRTVTSLQVVPIEDGNEQQVLIGKLCARNAADRKAVKEKTKLTPQHYSRKLQWTPEVTSVWLQKQGFANQARILEAHGVDGLRLVMLTLEELRAMQVEPHAVRRDLLDAIDRLKRNIELQLRNEWGEEDDPLELEIARLTATAEGPPPEQLTHLQQLELQKEKYAKATPLKALLREQAQLEQEAYYLSETASTTSYGARPSKTRPLTGNLQQNAAALAASGITEPEVISPRRVGSPVRSPRGLTQSMPGSLRSSIVPAVPEKVPYTAILAAQNAEVEALYRGSQHYEKSVSSLPRRIG
eukprot:TRINITY_DN41447_c0_g1_i1.p1 TRINITY_DN41447_c0_g1~~TRINITY_DN41447_c0_g1_i1.p1  ORF type:complete len:600 (-),score=97.31 TRINITY_DN41447_c0_g1_i1:4-1803(-)